MNLRLGRLPWWLELQQFGDAQKIGTIQRNYTTLSYIFSFSQLMEYGYGDSEVRKLGSIKVIEKESEFAMLQ